MLDAKGLKS